MQIFNCQKCEHAVFFENTHCESCQTPLGYSPHHHELVALTPTENEAEGLFTTQSASTVKYCANFSHNVCNWLVDDASENEYCPACELNRYIPNLKTSENNNEWRQLEFAKHRLVYSLLKFKLPLVTKKDDPEQGLAFDFISEDDVIPEDAQSMTGHADGQVTIKAEEADSAEREKMRNDMNEPYRTLLGHFRHEVGHYYWDQLVASSAKELKRFRKTFGNETEDYQEALKAHYTKGHSDDWKQAYVSEYAASHPWEDWAETWAHYFHIIDSLETAYAFGLSIEPPQDQQKALHMKADIAPYTHDNFDDIYHRCINLTLAVNSINRSMGQPDLYPFVLTGEVKSKLHFIHRLIRST